MWYANLVHNYSAIETVKKMLTKRKRLRKMYTLDF